jgi:hypothetical protein
MNRPSNREIEQYYFKQFRGHFPLPEGEVEHGDKPDVVIHGERVLGIEIANLYLTDGGDPTSEQVQRKRREDVVCKAQTQHSLAGGKKIELTVSFDPARPITDVNSVASALAAVAQSIQNLPAGPLSWQQFAQIPQLNFVYYNPIEYPDARWRVSQVFSGVDLSVDRVAQLVNTKEKRLAEYSKCAAYWLLLVVDFMDSAQDQELVWPSEVAPLKTTYERVIIYKPQFAQWIQAPVEPNV